MAQNLSRAPTGLVIVGFIGFEFVTVRGFSRLADALLDGRIQMIRAISFLAMLPLVIVWFGLEEGVEIFWCHWP